MNIFDIPLPKFAFQFFDAWRIPANEFVAAKKEVALAVVDVTLNGIVYKHGKKLIVQEPPVVVSKEVFAPLFHRPSSSLHVVQIADAAGEKPRV